MRGKLHKSVLLSLALVCSGCNSEAEKPLTLATDSDVAKVVKALELSSAPSGDQVDYELVRNNAARDCLRKMGHDAAPIPIETSGQKVVPWRTSLQWVDSGNTRFAEYVRDSSNFNDDEGNLDPKYELSEEAGKMFWGFPEESVEVDYGTGGKISRVISGCYGQVTNEVFGVDATTYEKTVGDTKRVRGLAKKAANHPDVRDRAKKYSECMKKTGFTTPAPAITPEELNKLVSSVKEGSAQPDQVASKEQEFTTADRKCKSESKISHAFAAAYLADYEEAQKTAEAALASLNEMHKHAREYARNAQ